MTQNFTEAITAYMQRHGYKRFSPRAVLFDMDGVLYDSMPNHARAWVQSMSEAGLRMSSDDAFRYEGMRGVETIKLIARQQWGRTISDAESQAIYDEKSRLYALQPKAGKISGVEELMLLLDKMDITIGVVTGSGQHSLLDKLEEEFAGLVSRERMVTSFDVSRGKPCPDPYLMGMHKCGVKPWQTIVVENAPLGVRAGVAAGCFTIGVNTGPLQPEELAREGANLVFDRMTDLRDQIVELLQAIDDAHLGQLKRETAWHVRYAEALRFVEANRRCPSKYADEQHPVFNWIKYNRKRLAHGLQPATRIERMQQLLTTMERYRRLNNYAYADPSLNRRQPASDRHLFGER